MQRSDTNPIFRVMISHMSGPTRSSNKTFGLFFAFIFVSLSFFAFSKNHSFIAFIAFTSSVILIMISVFQPRRLSHLNAAWEKLSSIISKVTSPIIMGIIFVCLFVPISFFGKLRGRDELRLRPKIEPSYWIDVSPVHDEVFSFRNQY